MLFLCCNITNRFALSRLSSVQKKSCSITTQMSSWTRRAGRQSSDRSVMPTVTEMDFTHFRSLCHCQELLLPVKGNTPSYAQLYVYNPLYATQRWSERNENLDNITKNFSAVLAQYNPLARIYRHAYEILTNHVSSSINSEYRANNNGSTESESPYIIISPSMRIRLIEGDDRRAQDLPTMKEVVATIQIECNNRGFCSIVLTLRSSNSNDNLYREHDFE